MTQDEKDINEVKESTEKTQFSSDVKIANEVIGSIASLAASDVEGVVSMAAADISSFLGIKSARKGVRVSISNDKVSFKLYIVVKYGSNIPDVCLKVQKKVKTTVENMTGLTVEGVEVTVSGITVAEN